MTPSTSIPKLFGAEQDYQYLLRSVYGAIGLLNDMPLFATDAKGLFELYLQFLPPEDRQHHNCTACKRFLETYGGLVAISPLGGLIPVFWNTGMFRGNYYDAAVAALHAAAKSAKVTGPFLSGDEVWGHPQTGTWTHFSAIQPQSSIVPKGPLTAKQIMAEKRQEYGTTLRAIEEFSVATVKTALVILESDALYRSEKVLGAAQWLNGIHSNRAAIRREDYRSNLLWLAVATAPAGFCHPRSSMIGTLLEDIVAGRDIEDIQRRFAEKMHPLQYQRPQAPPSAGNIAQGEKIIEKMGAAASLRRRFAVVEEITALWRPAPTRTNSAPAGGVFSHLAPKEPAPASLVDLPSQTVTWHKFSTSVMPKATAIDFVVPSCAANYSAILTAADPDAPPILQWDMPEARNQFSWYVYPNGSMPSQWGLNAGARCKVTAVSLQPSQWNGGFEHHGESVLFVLAFAADTRRGAGNGLFPEMLKADFHSVRATIEAYARTAELEGRDSATACGIRLQKGSMWAPIVFRVTTDTSVSEYKIDRWD